MVERIKSQKELDKLTEVKLNCPMCDDELSFTTSKIYDEPLEGIFVTFEYDCNRCGIEVIRTVLKDFTE